jgi:putative lipoprotein
LKDLNQLDEVTVGRQRYAVLLFLIAACGPARDGTADSVSTDTAARPQPASAPWDDARARGVDFRAIGQEPGWMLEIDNDKSLYLLADYGEQKVTAPAPALRDSADVAIYTATSDTLRLTVHVRAVPCADAMSGEEMTHSVTVFMNERQYTGCGRDLRR